MTVRHGAHRWAVVMLAASTAAGTAAWFLPSKAKVTVAVAALVIAIAGLSLTGDGVRRAFPLVMGVGIISAPIAAAVVTDRRDWWTTAVLAALAGALAAANGLMAQTMPTSWSSRRLARLLDLWGSWWQPPRPSPVMTHLAELVRVTERQTASIDELTRQNADLRMLINQFRHELAEAQRQNRRSTLLSFWGGVACSIPIGVLINLATG